MVGRPFISKPWALQAELDCGALVSTRNGNAPLFQGRISTCCQSALCSSDPSGPCCDNALRVDVVPACQPGQGVLMWLGTRLGLACVEGPADAALGTKHALGAASVHLRGAELSLLLEQQAKPKRYTGPLPEIILRWKN